MCLREGAVVPMKVEVTEAGAWRRTLDIEVPREDVDERLKAAFMSYSKALNLPGFRKGKVPVSIVKARFGPAILDEVIAKTEEECYREASQEKGLQPVSQATIEESSFEDGEPLKFKASPKELKSACGKSSSIRKPPASIPRRATVSSKSAASS